MGQCLDISRKPVFGPNFGLRSYEISLLYMCKMKKRLTTLEKMNLETEMIWMEIKIWPRFGPQPPDLLLFVRYHVYLPQGAKSEKSDDLNWRKLPKTSNLGNTLSLMFLTSIG